jgi:teichuronic acid biosynthesis glycosyltransferase TuaC
VMTGALMQVSSNPFSSTSNRLARSVGWPTKDVRPIKVLSFSTLFPNNLQPSHGVFLRHRLAHLSRSNEIRLQIVAPVPWFPFSHPAFGRYSLYHRVSKRSDVNGVAVLHPHYAVVPKIGMTVAPLLLAAALLPKLAAMQRTTFDFDIIDSYYLYPDGVAAALLGLALNRPVLLTAFGNDVSLLPNYAAARRQILWSVSHSAGVTAVCDALKSRLVRLGVEADKISVIRHGVDLNLFKPPLNRVALRRRLGFDRITFISVGHLIPRKGHDLAIAALAGLPGTGLVIVGEGPEKASLQRLAVARGIADRVRFLGQVDQRRIPELLGAADALILCSEREGIANVLMEALACGTPVAATPVWGLPEVLVASEAGVLFEDRSVGAVVEGIRHLLANPPDRCATRKYAERFKWKETAARHLALIRGAVHLQSQRQASRPMRLSQF